MTRSYKNFYLQTFRDFQTRAYFFQLSTHRTNSSLTLHSKIIHQPLARRGSEIPNFQDHDRPRAITPLGPHATLFSHANIACSSRRHFGNNNNEKARMCMYIGSSLSYDCMDNVHRERSERTVRWWIIAACLSRDLSHFSPSGRELFFFIPNT